MTIQNIPAESWDVLWTNIVLVGKSIVALIKWAFLLA